jgi:hypothetical protein
MVLDTSSIVIVFKVAKVEDVMVLNFQISSDIKPLQNQVISMKSHSSQHILVFTHDDNYEISDLSCDDIYQVWHI